MDTKERYWANSETPIISIDELVNMSPAADSPILVDPPLASQVADHNGHIHIHNLEERPNLSPSKIDWIGAPNVEYSPTSNKIWQMPRKRTSPTSPIVHDPVSSITSNTFTAIQPSSDQVVVVMEMDSKSEEDEQNFTKDPLEERDTDITSTKPKRKVDRPRKMDPKILMEQQPFQHSKYNTRSRMTTSEVAAVAMAQASV